MWSLIYNTGGAFCYFQADLSIYQSKNLLFVHHFVVKLAMLYIYVYFNLFNLALVLCRESISIWFQTTQTQIEGMFQNVYKMFGHSKQIWHSFLLLLLLLLLPLLLLVSLYVHALCSYCLHVILQFEFQRYVMRIRAVLL